MPSPRSQEDYYELLGVDPHVDDEELRRAWKRLALKWHPDRAGSDTGFIFARLAAAYGVLCDPDARAAYDRQRGIRRPPPPEPPPVVRAPGVLLMRYSRPLDALLALGIARELPDGVIELTIDESDRAEGGMIRISMRVPIHCDACNAAVEASCARCGGTRTLDETYSAWLALRPGVADGTVLTPSAQLPGVVRPVMFRVRLHHAV